MVDISIEHLLEEQRKSMTAVIIEAIHGEEELVKVTPWTPGMKCVCGRGIVMPRAAIKGIVKTGKTLTCGSRTLQIVQAEFSSEKLVSYGELFAAVRANQAAERKAAGKKPRSVRRLLNPGWHIPIFKTIPMAGDDSSEPSTQGGGDGSFEQQYVDCFNYCVDGFITNKPANLTQMEWRRQVYNACATACQAKMTGSPIFMDGDDDDS